MTLNPVRILTQTKKMADHFNLEIPISLLQRLHDHSSDSDSTTDDDDDATFGETLLDEGTEILRSSDLGAQLQTQGPTSTSDSEVPDLLGNLLDNRSVFHALIMAPDDRTIQTLFAEIKSKQPATRHRAAVEIRNAVFAAYRGKSSVWQFQE